MKINLNIPYVNLFDDQIRDENGEPLALKTVVVNALCNQVPGESGEKMLTKFDLARTIKNSPEEVELKESERELILKAVQQTGITLAYGQLHYLFKE